MSKTFYGNFLRERFPYKGKIRSEEDSVGARLLNSLGSEIEESYRRKLFDKSSLLISSSKKPLKSLGTLYAYDLSESEEYINSVLQEKINDFSITDVDRAKTLEDLFNSIPSGYSLNNSLTKLSTPPILYQNISREVVEEKLLEEECYIYINVKNVAHVFQKVLSENSGITLRGYDKHMRPIEEFIKISSCKMYKSKHKFFILSYLAEDKLNGISGGNPISVSSLKTFSIDVLRESCRSWQSKEDYRLVNDSEQPLDTFVKRIEIPGLISKPKLDRIFFDKSVTDNDLLIELSKFSYEDENRSKVRFIHRFFNNIEDYVKETNSVVIDEDVFEQSIGEVELLDNNQEPITVIDADYDLKSGKLFVLDSESNLLVYDVGMPLCSKFELNRTFNPGVRIDLLDTECLKGETVDVRIINSSIDKPLSNFIIGKIENDEISFLNENKDSFGLQPGLFKPIFAEDLQDTVNKFTFSLDVRDFDIEVFVLCFDPSSKNSSAISKIIAGEINTATQLTNAFDIDALNVRKIVRSYLAPIKVYSGIVNSSFTINNLYFKGANNQLWFVTDTNHHYCYEPKYNKAYFENHTLYRTEAVTGSFDITFELFSKEKVTVNLNASN